MDEYASKHDPFNKFMETELGLSWERCDEKDISTVKKKWGAKQVHLFVDASNILVKAKSIMDPKLLVDVILQGRKAARKLVVTSSNRNILDSNFIPRDWENAGFEVTVLQRVLTDSGAMREQSVDDLLHASMLCDILKDYGGKRVMILLSGDGNDNSGRTSFPTVIEKALLKGAGSAWEVEVFSWQRSASGIYKQLSEAYPEHMGLYYLDFLNFSTSMLDKQCPLPSHGALSKRPRSETSVGSSSASNKPNHKTVHHHDGQVQFEMEGKAVKAKSLPRSRKAKQKVPKFKSKTKTEKTKTKAPLRSSNTSAIAKSNSSESLGSSSDAGSALGHRLAAVLKNGDRICGSSGDRMSASTDITSGRTSHSSLRKRMKMAGKMGEALAPLTTSSACSVSSNQKQSVKTSADVLIDLT